MRTAHAWIGLGLVLAGITGQLQAGEYTPDDLYQYHYTRLPNGLQLFLKPRSGSHNVAIRLAVHVGSYDYPCGKKETPHFLEHLLFTGTSKHSEMELDALIEDNGGSWNATTAGEKTIYMIDIHDRHARLALQTLYEIVTDSQLAAEDIERTRDIVHREKGGRPSEFRRWLYRAGIGKSAASKADDYLWPREFNCTDLEIADGITRDDILTAHRQHYVPNNMALIVVGNFRLSRVRTQIDRTFGRLSAGNPPERTTGKPPEPVRTRLTGTFSPILGTDGQVTLTFQTRGYASKDIFPLILLENLLQQKLFNELRIRRGLSYSPASQFGVDRDTGALSLTADVGLENIDAAEQAMAQLIDTLRREPITPAELDRVRRRVLLAYAQGYESNNEIADHYASVWRRFEHQGRLLDLERELNHVTPVRVKQIVTDYLDPARVIVQVDTPTLSHHQLYVVIGLLISMTGLGTGFIFWRRRRLARREGNQAS